MTVRDWIPRLRGEIYCAPACGCGCTKAAFDKATADAAALAARMGDGWVPRVWENLGWHYEVIKGCAELHPPERDGTDFSLFFNAPRRQVVFSGEDPHELLRAALEDTRQGIADLQAAVDLFGR